MIDQHFLGFHEEFPFILPVFNKPLLGRELVLEVFGELSQPIYYFFFFSWKKGADKLTEVGEEGWGLAWPVPHDEAGGPFASLSPCLSSIKYQALQSCDHAMAQRFQVTCPRAFSEMKNLGSWGRQFP